MAAPCAVRILLSDCPKEPAKVASAFIVNPPSIVLDALSAKVALGCIVTLFESVFENCDANVPETGNVASTESVMPLDSANVPLPAIAAASQVVPSESQDRESPSQYVLTDYRSWS